MNSMYFKQNPKKLAVAATAVIVLISLVSWIYSHAFISVTVSGGSNSSEFTYTLVDDEGETIAQDTKKSPNYKKLVKKGSYEILATQGETSFFQIGETGAFLSNEKFEGNLEAEKSRTFIGNNPGPCMYYSTQALLYSAACDTHFEGVVAHTPATAALPTTTLPPALDLGDPDTAGLAAVNGVDKILLSLNLHEHSAEGPSNHNELYTIKNGFELSEKLPLEGLPEEGNYTIASYKQGLIVYDSSYSKIYYYVSGSSKPEVISINPPDIKTELTPFQLSIDGDRISVAYSDNAGGESTGRDDINDEKDAHDSSKGKIYLQVYQSGSTKSLEFTGTPAYAQLCAQKYFCLVLDRMLSVYDIAGNEAVLKLKLSNVKRVESANSQLIVMRDTGIFGIDIEKASGSIQYSAGEYSMCGLQATQAPGYVVCVSDPKNNFLALYIDTQKPNNDSIDKRILGLINEPAVDTVSIYRSFIHIIPKLGEATYNQETRSYGVDPAQRKKAAQAIDLKIKEFGIDTSVYTVVNQQ